VRDSAGARGVARRRAGPGRRLSLAGPLLRSNAGWGAPPVLQFVVHSSSYEGIPLSELRINHIEWTPERAEHIRTRSTRYARAQEFDVEPEWATESALDPHRRVSTTSSKSIEVIGLSASAPARVGGNVGRVLKIWLYPKDLDRGHWYGASACEANEKERRIYQERRSET
jgi:hypothetical protein